MNLDKLLGIFGFIIVGMLIFSAVLAFAEGHYLLGAIRVMLIIASCWAGWANLKSGFAEED